MSAEQNEPTHAESIEPAKSQTLLSTGSEISPWSGPLDVVDALLGLALATALWFAFFGGLAKSAERAIGGASYARRPALARDAYTLGNFPLIVGIVYTALGLTLVLHDLGANPSDRASGIGITTLAGGLSLYYLGLALFRRLTLGSSGIAPIIGAAVLVLVGLGPSQAPGSVLLALLTGVAIATSVALQHLTPGGKASSGAMSGVRTHSE